MLFHTTNCQEPTVRGIASVGRPEWAISSPACPEMVPPKFHVLPLALQLQWKQGSHTSNRVPGMSWAFVLLALAVCCSNKESITAPHWSVVTISALPEIFFQHISSNKLLSGGKKIIRSQMDFPCVLTITFLQPRRSGRQDFSLQMPCWLFPTAGSIVQGNWSEFTPQWSKLLEFQEYTRRRKQH